VLAALHSSSSDISGLPSDSSEDIIERQQDIVKSQRLVNITSGNLKVDIKIFATTL
jgi:hypothetical protein